MDIGYVKGIYLWRWNFLWNCIDLLQYSQV